MASGIVVKDLDQAGGKQLGGGQDFFRINGKPVVLLGDKVEPHQDGPHRANPTMVEASSFFKVNGIPVCREGDKASCGHASTGQSNFKID